LSEWAADERRQPFFLDFNCGIHTSQQEARGDEQKGRDPEGVFVEELCRECTDDRAEEECAAGESNNGELAQARVGVYGCQWWKDGIVRTFNDGPEIPGHEGDIEGDVPGAAYDGDDDRTCDGEHRDEDVGRYAARQEACEGEDDHLQQKRYVDGVGAMAAQKIFACDDANGESKEWDEVADDLHVVGREERDAEENEIPGHGVGEDLAVLSVDDGIEQSAGHGKERDRGNDTWRFWKWIGQCGSWLNRMMISEV
jgi:hypothetical protein